MHITKIFYLLLSVILLSSCVARKKYDELLEEKLKLTGRLTDCEDNLKMAKLDIDSLNEEIDDYKSTLTKLRRDSSETHNALKKQRELYSSINDSYEELLNNHKELLNNSSAKSSKLQSNLSEAESKLLAMKQENIRLKSTVDSLSYALDEKSKKLTELEEQVAQKEQLVNQIKEKLSKALLSFKESDLSVEIKDGNVYVSLADKLLFKSGSYKIDKEGKKAISQIADILKSQSDISIQVEGHTDDVPIASGTQCLDDNWDLSVLRANAIVRVLIDNGVDPKIITSAGRSQYHPVVDAKTKEARRKNRRSEIILTPDLMELYDIINEDKETKEP